MSWQKFSDRARESRKVRRASPEAITLWWAVGNYCCEHRTNGFIAKDELEDAWRPIGRRFNHAVVARECVSLGLFTDHGDHLEVHDFLEFNPSREQDDERKAKDAKRAAAYRARQKAMESRGIAPDVTRDVRSDERSDALVTHAGSSPDVTQREENGVTGEPSGVRHAPFDPSRPVPTRPDHRSTNGGAPPRSPHGKLYDYIAKRWRELHEQHRGQATRDERDVDSIASVLLEQAALDGLDAYQLSQAVLELYWQEDWPRTSKGRVSPQNLFSQLDRLVAEVREEWAEHLTLREAAQ